MKESRGESPGVRVVEIKHSHDGQRIDNYLLTLFKGVPRSHIYRLLRTGQVRVNKGRIKPTYRLIAGDLVRIPPVHQSQSLPVQIDDSYRALIEAAIIHEDEDIMVLDKPAGMAVHGGSGLRFGLIEALKEMRPACPEISLVHRLDRFTSGCLLVAKNRAMLPSLNDQFRTERVEKQYLALVRGRWQGGARTVDLSLLKGRLQSGERMVQVDEEEGKDAESRFTPVEVFAEASLMQVVLKTGRMHQIRVHAAGVGHPLAGDEKYGDPDFNRTMKGFGLKRQFLHAQSLSFYHPRTGRLMSLSTPLPAALSQVLEHLPR
ncbi:MAG: RluA family pseudouridine synthase [Gammaproteobacteria bacterium]|nr:RluA family pseudouridine synthase [Gammaproteobacteria bacterium]